MNSQYLINDYRIFHSNVMRYIPDKYKDPHTDDACGNDLPSLNCVNSDTDDKVLVNYIRLWNCISKRHIINEAFNYELTRNRHLYANNVLKKGEEEYTKHKHMENALLESYYKNCENILIRDRLISPFDNKYPAMLQSGGKSTSQNSNEIYKNNKSTYIQLCKNVNN